MGKNDYLISEVLLPGSLLQLLQWDFLDTVLLDYQNIHQHDYWQCNWGLRGSCDVCVDDAVVTLHRGDMLFIPPNTPHKLVNQKNFLSLSFKYRTNLSVMNEVMFVPKSRASLGIIRAAEILVKTAFPVGKQGVKTSTAIAPENHYHHTIEYLIAGTINFLVLKNNPLPKPADSLRHMLHKSGGLPLAVGDAAAACMLSRNHLCNLVKQQTGMSAKEFIDRERALIASQYLKFSDMNIEEIADRMGFPSSGHFGKFFQRVCGCTPGKYRNLAKLAAPEHAK